jgi:two-component system response regulator DevR
MTNGSEKSEKSVRILIADDHPVVRAGLRTLLEGRENFRVVDEAATGEEAVAKAQDHRPDIVLLDSRMPNMSGMQACRQIVDTVEGCRVVILTAYATDELVFAAMRAGASSYLLKRMEHCRLFETIERVNRGEEMLDSDAAHALIDEFSKLRRADFSDSFAELTQREIEVLALMAEGATNKEIATSLSLSVGTIRNYVSKIFSKLNISNRAEAAAYAVRHHIARLTSLAHAG